MPKLKNSEILSLYQELVKVKREKKDLEDREKILKFALTNSIPIGKSKAGIMHITKTHTSVAWKKISNAFLESYIPKKQKIKALEEISKFTTESSYSTFKEEK